ncbi:hypothetical protein ACIP5Y_18060 [Nocardia sp. NPDC088792]|uniref:hypothetical protein n=1 Tax=Nocardia sp. NPDC088792 TaxID=3364332 RepID=UPI0037F1EB5C
MQIGGQGVRSEDMTADHRRSIDLVLLRTHKVRRTRPWPSFDSGDPGFATNSEDLLDEAYGE